MPEGVVVDIFDAVNFDQCTERDFALECATAGLGDFLTGERVLIIVNDAYRRTPTAQLLDWLERHTPGLVDRAGFLIATGSHKPPTEAQLASLFGQFFPSVRSRIRSHDAAEKASLGMVGTDSFGKPVLVNSALLEADRVLIIGSVEPHYFAGYTGGRKSLVPGLLDLESIERNHNLANSLDAAPLRLIGNPVAEHLDSLLDFLPLKRIRSIQVVESGGRLAGIFCGAVRESFKRAVMHAHALFARPVAKPYDIALCELLSPLCKNLYQSQKALENCQMGVADGGAAVVISPCDEGVGSSFFFDLADQWDRERNAPVDGIPRFGSHKLSRVNAVGRRIDVRLHSELAEQDVRKVYYEPVRDISAFIRERTAGRSGLRIAVVHDAGNTVLTRETFGNNVS